MTSRAAPPVEKREQLLFISPIWPERGGIGLAQRAYQWLRRLSREGDVHLLVVERIPTGVTSLKVDDEGKEELELASVHVVCPTPRGRDYWRVALLQRVATTLSGRAGSFGAGREWLFLTMRTRRLLRRWYGGENFSKVVCFRLQLRDYGQWFKRAGLVAPARLQLDLDDLESETRASIAGLLAARGHEGRARALQQQARRARAVEREASREFDRVHLAAEEDVRRWAAEYPWSTAEVVPNVLPALPSAVPPASLRRMLFVGTLGYFPNEDAVLFLLEEVLPALRAEAADWTLLIAGQGASPALASRCAATAGVEFVGGVGRIATVYERAGIVVAPVRGGGGTKIKVLEALAFGRPLIAATHAARGWGLETGVHFLRADTPEAWVQACRDLAADPQRAARLGESGRTWVATHGLGAAAERGNHG